MKSKSLTVWVMAVVFVLATNVSAATVFSDDFENDITGTFPSKWVIQHKDPVQINADAVVVDRTTAPGMVYGGDKSARITFTGGRGSGIKTTFNPVTQGVVSFYCMIEWASDDLQLMGLHSFSNTELEESHLITISAQPFNSVWEYSVAGASLGIPVVFGEYDRFDFHFDADLDVATLYINSQITSVVNFPFEVPSEGLTTLRSVDDSGPGTAQWYLDNVTVTPEPATLLLLGLGAVMGRRKRCKK
jgi:hypothetical protein